MLSSELPLPQSTEDPPQSSCKSNISQAYLCLAQLGEKTLWENISQLKYAIHTNILSSMLTINKMTKVGDEKSKKVKDSTLNRPGFNCD